jgi:hypothetical protein
MIANPRIILLFPEQYYSTPSKHTEEKQEFAKKKGKGKRDII